MYKTETLNLIDMMSVQVFNSYSQFHCCKLQLIQSAHSFYRKYIPAYMITDEIHDLSMTFHDLGIRVLVFPIRGKRHRTFKLHFSALER